jgi:serine/threonine protein kinase
MIIEIDTEANKKSTKHFGKGGRFKKLRTLGKGTYGEVYECQDQREHCKVALKKLIIRGRSQGIPATTIREIGILLSLQHENIVKLKSIDQDTAGVYLIFEMMHTDLSYLIKKHHDLLSVKAIKYITYQILKGVDYMHSKRIFHRDLKPANILVNNTGTAIKIADFGLSRTIHQPFRPYSHEILTIWYRSPEMCLDKCSEYSIGVDVWSIACILAEMALGSALFKGNEEMHMLYQYFKVFGFPADGCWPKSLEKCSRYDFGKIRATEEGKNIDKRLAKVLGGKSFYQRFSSILGESGADLLRLMFALDPLRRVSCREAMKHTFFDEVRMLK